MKQIENYSSDYETKISKGLKIDKKINRYEFISIIRKKQKELKNDLIFEDDNCTVYTKKGELSKGCKTCKSGRWICLFVGVQCNADCNFCLQKNQNSIEHEKALQNMWIDDFKRCFRLLETENYIEGISYSGGETFLYLDKVIKIAEFLKDYPHIYQWIYTNGKLVTKDNLKKIKDAGVNEIRFNLSAFDFDPGIIEKLKWSREIIGKVLVEVPSDKVSYDKLVKQKFIHTLAEYGINQLNLAELILGPNKIADIYKESEKYLYDSVFVSITSPLESRIITYDIIEYAVKHDLNILINDCSNEAKDLQLMKKYFNPIVFRLFPQ